MSFFNIICPIFKADYVFSRPCPNCVLFLASFKHQYNTNEGQVRNMVVLKMDGLLVSAFSICLEQLPGPELIS